MTDKKSLKDTFRTIFWIVAISVLVGLSLTVFFVINPEKIPQKTVQDSSIVEIDTAKSLDTIYISKYTDTLVIIKQ